MKDVISVKKPLTESSSLFFIVSPYLPMVPWTDDVTSDNNRFIAVMRGSAACKYLQNYKAI
jgi:hypothetical protein